MSQDPPQQPPERRSFRRRPTLVTAPTTPLGSALIEDLLATGHPVLAVHDEAQPAHRVPGARYLRADLTRYRDTRELLRGPAADMNVRAIVHTALHRDPRGHGLRVWQQNVQSTRQLLSLAEEDPKIERFVFRSHAEVYRAEVHEPVMLGEDAPLELSPRAPQRVRNRVEADMLVCAKMGVSRLGIVVLRCAEVVAPELGSQLHDYLGSAVCLTPLGYDPMINVLSPRDAARVQRMAVDADAVGVFNIPGLDTLPLSQLVRRAGSVGVPVPGPTLGPLYGLRALTRGAEFRYGMNRRRFHHSALLDGSHAQQALGYVPRHTSDLRVR
jgi:UDP-glucose 4-epimerase